MNSFNNFDLDESFHMLHFDQSYSNCFSLPSQVQNTPDSVDSEFSAPHNMSVLPSINPARLLQLPESSYYPMYNERPFDIGFAHNENFFERWNACGELVDIEGSSEIIQIAVSFN